MESYANLLLFDPYCINDRIQKASGGMAADSQNQNRNEDLNERGNAVDKSGSHAQYSQDRDGEGRAARRAERPISDSTARSGVHGSFR